MFKHGVLIVLGALALQAAAQKAGLDALIDETFKQEQPAADAAQSDNEEDCTCVPYYQCQNGTVIQNGVGLIDIRIKDGPCDSYLDVCCQSPLTEKTNPPPQVRTGSCGARHPDGVGFRITGDEDSESQFGEFPWMVAVLREESLGESPEKLNVYKCGGSLIHPRVVITAAHCVAANADGLKVRAGEWDTQTKNELLPHQDRDVVKVIVHPAYHPQALYNDVALLILESPVDLTDNVDVVCLPNQGDVFDGSSCFASGWGKDVFGKEGRYQVILKKIELPLVPHQECLKALRATRLGGYFQLHDSFLCAGGVEGRDTCKGDGGSPLVCPLISDPARYVQAGIVAWGIGCGDATPGVYAAVAQVRNWVDQQMADNELDDSSYKA